MLAGGYSWRLFFYVVAAFSGALFVAAFFLAEESRYHRPDAETESSQVSEEEAEKQTEATQIESLPDPSIPPRKSFLETLKPWAPIDHEADFFGTILRSFAYFLVPAVLWVITSFGNQALPLLPTASPS
jgi:Flp pilus assembly protein TadB